MQEKYQRHHDDESNIAGPPVHGEPDSWPEAKQPESLPVRVAGAAVEPTGVTLRVRGCYGMSPPASRSAATCTPRSASSCSRTVRAAAR